MGSKPAAKAILLAALASGLVACDMLPPEAEKFRVQLQKEWDALLIVLTGGRSPLGKAFPKPEAADAAGGEQEFSSPNARNAKANAELLQEVYRTVFMREPKDRAEFGSLVDSLNQGASVEGVYNGFTHSTDYRRLEMANAGATPEALRVFGEELAILEAELPVPSELEATAPPGAVTGADAKALSDRYTRQFVGASIFTLKRVLGDEALKVVAAKKEYREKLAQWYSSWVARLAGRNVDFGIALRNKPDEAFHYKWALSAPEDRIRWEVLNRLHRVLNEANRQKQ